MARLSVKDNLEARELCREILTLPSEGKHLSEWILPSLCEFLDAEVAGVYSIRSFGALEFELESDNWHCRASAPIRSRVLRDLARKHINAHPSGWGNIDPARPAPAHRNNVYVLHVRKVLQGPSSPLRDRIERMRVDLGGVGEYSHTRTLICEGGSMLAWVGIMQGDEPTDAQKRKLAALTPALRQCLLTQRNLGNCSVFEAAFAGAADSIPAPTFIVSSTGAIAFANAVGQQRLHDDRKTTVETIRAVLAGSQPGRAMLVSAQGAPKQHLMVLDDAPSSLEHRVGQARASWNLTGRQAQVLLHLACGESNQATAAALGCSVRTVEAHVTALMRKAEVESRAQLIAALWRLRC